MIDKPMLRTTHSEPDMVLPEGKTCGDCYHFKRCNSMFGHIAKDEVCDWSPSRFVQPLVRNAAANNSTPE